MKLIILIIFIAFFPFVGYVPSSMSIEAFNNIDLYRNLIFNDFDFQYYGGKKNDNHNFYFFGIIFTIINLLKIHQIYISYIWYTGIFIVGAIGISELIKTIAIKEKIVIENFKRIAVILFFIFNYFTIALLDNGYLLFPYLIMPGLIATSLNYSESRSKKYLFFLIIFSNFNTTQITFNIINILITIVMVSHYSGIPKAVKCTLIIFGSSLWFWGSYLISAISPSKEILYASSDEGFEFYNRTTEFFEIIRLLGNWAVTDNVVPVAQVIGISFVGIIISFIPLLILTIILKQGSLKYKHSIVFFILFAIGTNPSSPVYYIIEIISINVNYFNMFRNTYKFVGPIVLLAALNYLFIKKTKVLILIYIYVFYSITSIYLTGIHPLDSKVYSIPNYWIEAEEHIKNNTDKRDNILLLPFEKNAIYEWGSYNGYYYGTPLNIKNPILHRTLSSTNNAIVENIRNEFIRNNPCEILKNKNIKLIINRNDIISKEYYNISSIKCGYNYKNFGPIEIISIK